MPQTLIKIFICSARELENDHMCREWLQILRKLLFRVSGQRPQHSFSSSHCSFHFLKGVLTKNSKKTQQISIRSLKTKTKQNKKHQKFIIDAPYISDGFSRVIKSGQDYDICIYEVGRQETPLILNCCVQDIVLKV